jgi:hypothetical protein
VKSKRLLLLLLRVPRRERDSVRRLAVEADFEGVLSWMRQGNVKDEHGAGLHVDHSRRRLPELHGALAAQQLGSGLVHEPNPYGMHTDLGAPPPNPEHQVSARIHCREVGEPDMLEHAEHTELALLIDQGVIRDDCEIEVQGSGDSD